ncbi:MAG: hypothetical protein ACYDA9_14100 [Terriglobia bacterium]
MDESVHVQLNRRIRRLERVVAMIGFLVLASIGGAFWLAARLPEPTELTVRRLTVVDDTGRIRAELATGGDDTHFWIRSQHSDISVGMRAFADLYEFSVDGPKGPVVLLIYSAKVSPTGSALILSAAPELQSKPYVRLDAKQGIAAVETADELGYRAVLGHTELINSITGEQHLTSAAALTFFDPKGNVIPRK